MQASLQKIARSSAFALLAGAATIASAQERARVISATPIVQQVGMPQQVCDNQTVYTGQQTTGGGAVLGAVAGGAVGNAIGGGSGRAAATALGVIGGALLGNQIEGNGKPQYQNVQRCHTETFYENRTVGYNVVYEFAGRQYTTQMSRHPGTTIAVQVQPVQDSQPDAVYAFGDFGGHSGKCAKQQRQTGNFRPRVRVRWAHQRASRAVAKSPVLVNASFGAGRCGRRCHR